MEIAFWICLALVFYIYVGYPMIVFILSQIFHRTVRKSDAYPLVTLIISAFNEEREIERTVTNKLVQDYPQDRLEIIVVSDGSTDRTDEIVQGLSKRHEGRLKFLRQEPRQGKTQALNLAVSETSSEILVFADANSMYAPDALRKIVRNFADPSVGYVTGQMIYTNPNGAGFAEGSGAYMRYENALRVWETQVGSVIGVDGGIDAVRRNLYIPMQPDQLPDFLLPLNVLEQGKRVVYEPEALLYEAALPAPTDEFRMRVRVSLRALWALYDKKNLLNLFRFPIVAWQLFSHKVLRYCAFFPLIWLLFFNVLVVEKQPFYLWFLVLQLLCYVWAASGHLLRRLPHTASKLLIPYYFVVLNIACVIAIWKFLHGQKIVFWKPRGGINATMATHEHKEKNRAQR